jgi:long-chain acyl-CoA synthetase
MNTADYLLQQGDDSRIALLTRNERYTYAELKQAAGCLVGALLERGVQPGDRIGLLGENSLFWVAAYLAILKTGAIAVPFPTVSTLDDVKKKEQFIRCKMMILDRRSYTKFSGALQHIPRISEESLQQPGKTFWDLSDETFDLNQDAALMLTSGTTASPRAVRITHQNIQANTNSIVEYLDLTCDDRITVILPFYYCFGTSLLHTHLRTGASLALCNTFAYPETALDLLDGTGSSGFAGVPSTYQTLLRNTTLKQRQLPSLRKIQQAGGKLQNVFIQELVKTLPDARVYVMYGQTEATARLSYLPPELLDTKLGSIGRGIPGVTLRVLDEAGNHVKPGQVGEIYAWGMNISPGYLEDPQATAEKFVEGALRTGDLATIDDDGFIYIVDRKGDFIKSMGHRVSSQEIEAHVLEIPEIVSAAAIGEADDALGEAIIVFATLKSGTPLTGEEILGYCRRHMARHMVPKEVLIIDRLPMNANGKIVKSELRSLRMH